MKLALNYVQTQPKTKPDAGPKTCNELRHEFTTCLVRQAPETFCFFEALTLGLCLEDPMSHS